MFRQDRTNPSTAVSNWRGRLDSLKGWPSTAVSTWLNGGLFGAASLYAGFAAGGRSTAGNRRTVVDKFAFPSDVRSSASALGTGVQFPAGFGDSGVAGYASGGSTPSSTYGDTQIQKYVYATDSWSNITATLATNTNGAAGFANSGTAGYTAAGNYLDGGFYYLTDVRKLAFPADTLTTISVGFSTARAYCAGFSNSGTAGYAGGGYLAPGYTTNVDKWLYSNDSRTSLGTGLDIGTSYIAGFGNRGVAGYLFGGFDGVSGATEITVILEQWTFASDTHSTLSAELSIKGYELNGMADSGVAGYRIGGYNNVTYLTTVDKLAFPGNTISTLGTGLSESKAQCAAFANEGALA